ncbi:transient receptor potential cation channel subfamily A member 1 homolog isoform X2 [Halichondria panicea]|uniref:transient receptor potential cation channel subfamily A member 1 homolog isoform X2 n=1 Tax=Halichondria panicea TaxID=6063 RepID=UPI00312B885A
MMANDGGGRRCSEDKQRLHPPNQNEDDDDQAVKVKSDEECIDTPAHIAAQSNTLADLEGQINGNPQCIYKKGASKQTVLHDAVESGDLDIVCFVLDIAKKHPPTEKHPPDFLNQRDVSDFTPLHLVAIHGSVDIAKLLIKHGASVNPKNGNTSKTPFHKAAYYGQVELALYLLEQGAEISYQAFAAIIGGGYEKLAKAVIETDQWPLALRGTYKRHEKETTAFRELIAKMPDVAEIVLNRCTVEKNKIRDGKDYEMLFNYEFIEDYNGGDTGKQESANRQGTAENEKEQKSACSGDTGKQESANCQGTAENQKVKEQKSDGSKKKTYGTSFAEITADQPATHRWGPNIFTKANHPLQIMVNYNRMNLLNHPVVGSLVHHKWKKYGFVLYITNLFVFVSFLVLLTTFALIVPNPKSEDSFTIC